MYERTKIKVITPLVDMDGDEMTRIMWKMVKEKLIFPYVDLPLEYYDLHVKHRNETDDKVTVEAAEAIKKYGVGVKCATITPDKGRMCEYNLKNCWKSPNGTIRGILDGTVFRTPIFVKNIRPTVVTWKKPITVGRHAYGEIYGGEELRIEGPGKVELVYTPACGEPVRKTVHDFKGPGIVQGIHNTDVSIIAFAKACFTLAYERKIDLWFSTKDTISKIYDGHFRNVFEQEYEQNWKAKFASAGICYFYTLIDDVVARLMRTEGGILLAMKNYDGDVQSDMVAAASGSLAMMTSVLVSPHGWYEFEAAHGTVQKHYYRHLKGEETSTNSIAIIFAWSGALRKRGEMDGTPEVIAFADKMEKAALETVEAGIMTGDLLQVAEKNPANRKVNTETFIDAIAANLSRMMA